ncbi:MAG: VWA domain-containing protein [Flavobacteriaceae bacterium]
MSSQTLVLIIIAGISALFIALFQYAYKAKKHKLNTVFIFLRCITIFAILLLIINPKFEKTSYFNVKPNLVIAVDNTQSINHLEQTDSALSLLRSIESNSELNQKFNLSFFEFGNELNTTSIDSLSFSKTQTNISKVFSALGQIYDEDISPTVLITDGNQTFGYDYEYDLKSYGQPVYPVILGDTVTYTDLKIQQLNVNKYAYLKNNFPVEIIAIYNGNETINTQLVVSSGNSVVFRQPLSFSKINNASTINFTLPANRVGVNSYTARLEALDNEKNIINNSKPFAVEVIDQKTNIAIVSDIIHPDLGMFKKSIEGNEQRSVSIVTPNEFLNIADNFQLAILYQPNSKFRQAYEIIENTGINKFVIAGSQTEWTFLNQVQDNYVLDITQQFEDYQSTLNSNFTTFIIDDLDFNSFPPLISEFGEINFNTTAETLLYKKVNNTLTDLPLLVTFESNGKREALLLGENIWKWRSQSYLNDKSFQQFDNFIGKLVQYLATNKKRSRLNVDHESFYNGNGNIIISAQFFNKNYEFDAKASINIITKHKESETETIVPFVLKNNNYQADLSGFPPGEYDYTVRANNGEVSNSGTFQILDYNVEQQFLNANVTKLQQLSTNSEGLSYFISNTENLITDLLNDSRYATIQKSTKNVVPLIDFKYLLALIALSLALEWFIRKYNGLI